MKPTIRCTARGERGGLSYSVRVFEDGTIMARVCDDKHSHTSCMSLQEAAKRLTGWAEDEEASADEWERACLVE